MAIIPTGRPAWARTNVHSAYGGDVNKVNYQGIGTVNPRTDLSAENLCRLAADLAAVARTAPFAVVTYTARDTSALAPTINAYDAMAGDQPTPSRNGDGDESFAWADSYVDDYGVSANANIVHAEATVHSESLKAWAVCQLLDNDSDGIFETVRVRVYNDAGSAVQDAKVTLVTFTGAA
jgi:hypothetical protein